MTKQNKQDEQLSALYQQRKQQHTAPSSIEQALQDKLRQRDSDKTPWWKFEFNNYFRFGAMAMTCALAFVVINMQTPNPTERMFAENSVAMKVNSPTVYHVLETSPLEEAEPQQMYADSESRALEMKQTLESSRAMRSQQSEDRRIKYRKAESDLLARQTTQQQIHQTYATIVSTEDGLNLLTCENELLKISQEVVNMLYNNKQTTQNKFEDGALVSLSLNSSGQIVQLLPETQQHKCEFAS